MTVMWTITWIAIIGLVALAIGLWLTGYSDHEMRRWKP